MTAVSEASIWPHDLARLVDDRRRALGWTWERLARESGLSTSRNAVSTIMVGHWPKHARLVRILDALGLTLEQAYPLPKKPTAGQLLRTMRRRQGLTLRQLGRQLGVSDQQILRIERDLMPRSPLIPVLLQHVQAPMIPLYDAETGAYAEALQRAMDERGWNPANVAAETGLDRMTIVMVLRGHLPTNTVARILHDHLELSPDLARPFNASDPLSRQLITLRWHANQQTEEFAQTHGLSAISYDRVVAGATVGPKLQQQLESLDVSEHSAQIAKTRSMRRKLSESLRRKQRSTFGRCVEERCIELGVWPRAIAEKVGMDPGTLRKWCAGVRPQDHQRVERIMDLLRFSPAQRQEIQAWLTKTHPEVSAT
jgi:transcriptional regulator with XRE-family HTH domain